MERFAGIREQNIVLITTHIPIDSKDVTYIKIPKNINLTDYEIMKDYIVIDGTFIKKTESVNLNKSKLAIITRWKMDCGISTYSEHLVKELKQYFKEIKIFSEQGSSDSTVCFKSGEPMSELVSEINNFNPDAILIQHEYGIFPIATHWLSMLTQLAKYPIIVTMHSIYKHRDKTISDAAIPNIVVHTELAKSVLIEKGIKDSSISVIPHGCLPIVEHKLWNFYQTDHTFMQFGFGFEYKGWEKSLEVCSILLQKYKDVFFTGLISSTLKHRDFHRKYHANLIKYAKELGIQNNCALILGFQKDESLYSYLKTNKVAVFPYIHNGEHQVYGVTGAARIAMSHGIPVITSTVPMFNDLIGVCKNSDNPFEIASMIEELWKYPKSALLKQKEYIENNLYKHTAKMYADLIELKIKESK